MLNWDIHILNESRVVCELLDELVGDLVGVAIKQTDPGNRRCLCDSADKLGKRVLAVEVESVARGILGDEVKLLDAHSLKVLRLLHDILDGARAKSAADHRNRAIGALVVTALCNLEVCGMLVGGENALAAEP